MNWKKSFLLFLVIATFLFRIYRIGSSPAGLYIDETSIGFNAYSIVKTGLDEHGKKFPLFFEAFGEYKLPIYVYSVALTQLFTGPTDISVRIPSLIFGIFCIPLIYLLARELTRDLTNNAIKIFVPIFAAILMSFSPWHFQFSRPGFEVGAGLFFLLLGLVLFYQALKQNSFLLLVMSFIAFVLTFYSYNSARIVTPFVLLVIIASYFKHFSVKQWLFAISIGLFISLPFIFFSFSSRGLVRAKQVSIFYTQTEKPKAIELASNYWSNISPIYLFKNGDPTIAHLTPYRMSLLHIFELPFVILGFFYLFRFFSKKTILLVSFIFIGFLPPAITTLNPHALRALFALPGLVIVSSFGLSYFISLISNVHLKQLFSLSLFFLIVLSFFNFLKIYHSKYAPSAWWDWQVDIKEMTTRVKQIKSNYSKVYFSQDIPRVSLLWYLGYDPKNYHNLVTSNDLGEYQLSFTGLEDTLVSKGSLIITRGLIYGNFKEYIYYPDGTVAFAISEI